MKEIGRLGDYRDLISQSPNNYYLKGNKDIRQWLELSVVI